jgi:hypothetical protein
VVPGIPNASRAHHFLVYQTRIERHSPVGADDRSRTGDLRVGTALFFLLNYDQRESPRDIRNITALAADRRVASPARLHARQRTPQIDRASAHRSLAPLQPSRIVRDRSIARSFRDGPDEYPSGLIHFPRPHAWRVVSMMSFSSLLTFCFLFCCLVGAGGFVAPQSFASLRTALTGVQWRTSRLVNRRAFRDRIYAASTAQPHTRRSPEKHKARSPFGASGPCSGLCWLELSIHLHPGCFRSPACSSRAAHC